MTFQTTTQSPRTRLTSAAAALLLTAGAVRAQTIHWGNNIFDDLVQSDGTLITAADGFHFELGIFTGGFTPTAGNPAGWMTSWRPLDAAVFNEAARYFSSSFNIIPDPGDPQQGYSDSPEAPAGLRVQEGQQLWLLVYNNTGMDTGTELFLAGAGTWTLPAVTGSQTAMPTTYRLSQALSAPVFGGANNNRGGGNYSDNPPAYTLQTATFIPEPASPALALAAAGLFSPQTPELILIMARTEFSAPQPVSPPKQRCVAECRSCGWSLELKRGSQAALPQGDFECPNCGCIEASLKELAARVALAPSPRMEQRGKVAFRLHDPAKYALAYAEEPEAVRQQRTRRHEKLLALLSPLAIVLVCLCGVLAVVMARRISPKSPVANEPIEFVPPGLSDEVEAARGVLVRYFAASSVEEKHRCILPGVTMRQMNSYFARGGNDPVLARENIIYTDRHSDRDRHWYSFTLTPPGTLLEIQAYVSTEGGRPLLHWQSYVQEKDALATRYGGSCQPGGHYLRVGLCRAARLDNKPRVAVVGLDGNTLCYADMELDNAGGIQSRLNYKRPEVATVRLTTRADGSKCVTQFISWGLDRLPSGNPLDKAVAVVRD